MTSKGEFPECPPAGANVCTLCTPLPITSPCPLPTPCPPERNRLESGGKGWGRGVVVKISGETLVTLVNDQNFFSQVTRKILEITFPKVGNFSKTLSGTGYFREVAERVPP